MDLLFLPQAERVLIILSGGLDSTIAMRIAIEKYGVSNVKAISFDYGQKQKIELQKAKESTALLGVEHKVFDLSVLNKISQGFSANVDTQIAMPTIQDVLGDPSPKTYVPNRNMVLMSLAASYAETKGIDTIIIGLQVHDQYGYHDTTQKFVDKINNVLSENRKIKIKVVAPFSHLSKTEELEILNQLDGSLLLTKYTITCYNPNSKDESCGNCPSCSERINAFMNLKKPDLIPYSKKIPWRL